MPASVHESEIRAVRRHCALRLQKWDLWAKGKWVDHWAEWSLALAWMALPDLGVQGLHRRALALWWELFPVSPGACPAHDVTR